MVGLAFTICLLMLLIAVGFIFAWMVRLASEPYSSSFISSDEVTAPHSSEKNIAK